MKPWHITILVLILLLLGLLGWLVTSYRKGRDGH